MPNCRLADMLLWMMSVQILLVQASQAENRSTYFTRLHYDLWCQENVQSNSLFLYPDRTPIGIRSTPSMISVSYYLIDDHHGLFQAHGQRLGDFYFLTLNITRPWEINREYQHRFVLNVRASIRTTDDNRTDHTEVRLTGTKQTGEIIPPTSQIHLHVADANDNDGVFDMDTFEKDLHPPIDVGQSILRVHASDADERHHGHLLYELGSSSFNDTFALHPLTGELYLLSTKDLQANYDLDIHVYDRHRAQLIHDRLQTRMRVRLNFHKKLVHTVRTISNELITFEELADSYEIVFSSRTNWTRLNLHQPILTIDIRPRHPSVEIVLLENSSVNALQLVINEQRVYTNDLHLQEYHLCFLLCFSNRTRCQYSQYRLQPSVDFNAYQFRLSSKSPIQVEENLPVHSFVTRVQLDYHQLAHDRPFVVHYRLLSNNLMFHLDSQSGVLRLADSLNYEKYLLVVQADILFFNQTYSLATHLEIHVREINKHRPEFFNTTLTILRQLPYQFHAVDHDRNQQTNGRIGYRLWNCPDGCPFQIHPSNGILSLTVNGSLIRDRSYALEILAYDCGEPISLETKLDIVVDLSSETEYTSDSPRVARSSVSEPEPVYFHMGFLDNSVAYHIAEDSPVDTIVGYVKLTHDPFPLFIDDADGSPFFFMINDTSIPFVVDPADQSIRLIQSIDRETRDYYRFEIELTLKSTYAMKFQSISMCRTGDDPRSNPYYQKITVHVHVDDVNDHTPTCARFHQQISLDENQAGAHIFQVHARDPDLGENGTIVYSLWNHQEYFTIDPQSGQIRSIRPVDRESMPSLRLHIVASDQGQQTRWQSICTTLHVTLRDINDNRPEFSSTPYVFHLFADLPRSTLFGQVYATDVDSNDSLTYSIESNPWITIDRHTGHLRVRESLADPVFNLTVKVTDGLHVNHTTVQIHVERFPPAQQPILLLEPAISLVINRSTSAGTVITNLYHRFHFQPSSIDHMELVYEGCPPIFSIDQQGNEPRR